MFPVASTSTAHAMHLAGSTCTRSLWPDGTVFELVHLSGSDDQLDRAQLDRIVAKLPTDGKKHALAEVM